jgi:hypothetical protein
MQMGDPTKQIEERFDAAGLLNRAAVSVELNLQQTRNLLRVAQLATPEEI